MTWQPIETAPKTEYPIFHEGVIAWNGRSVAHVTWCGRWEYANDGDTMPMEPQPTHWMPLPAPPTPNDDRVEAGA